MPRYARVCGAIGFVFVSAGIVIFAVFAPELSKLASAVQAKCQISGFQADMFQTIVRENRGCERSCDLYVKALTEAGDVFYVMDWKPEYRKSFHTSTGYAPVRDAFSCCPTPAEHCCGFVDLDSSLFCDNLSDLRKDCPSAPWPCYFLDLEQQLDENSVPASALRFGDSRAAKIPVTIAICTFAAGLLAFACINPRTWCVAFLRFSQSRFYRRRRLRFWLLFAKRIPKRYWTPFAWRAVADVAATIIQRWYRSRHSWVAFKEVAEVAKELVQKTKKLGNKAWSGEVVHGPSFGTLPEPGLLYDTGNSSTFRRFVHARVFESPTPGYERREIALTKQNSALIDSLRIVKGAAGEASPPCFVEAPPRAFADIYGIRRGESLIRVEQLEWPNASASALLSAAHSAKHPVVMVFESEAVADSEGIKRTASKNTAMGPPPLWRKTTAGRRSTRSAVAVGQQGKRCRVVPQGLLSSHLKEGEHSACFQEPTNQNEEKADSHPRTSRRRATSLSLPRFSYDTGASPSATASSSPVARLRASARSGTSSPKIGRFSPQAAGNLTRINFPLNCFGALQRGKADMAWTEPGTRGRTGNFQGKTKVTLETV